MIGLLDGVYEEDYSTSASNLGTSGGIGGTIGGKFIARVIGHPPCERRSITLGISDGVKPEFGSMAAGGPAFGWTDFLGLGSERAVGGRMRKLQTRLYAEGGPHQGNRHIAIAAECTLDKTEVLESIKALLQSYSKRPVAEYPLAIVFMGNFVSQAAMSGAGVSADDVEEGFNELAKVLAEFKELIGRTTLVFVPGDNDAWASSFSAGAATVLPRGSVPEMFTRKIKQAMSDANRELGTRGGRKIGEVVWATNPTRIGWFGGIGEMVCIRDDISSRFRRNGIRLKDGPDEQQISDARESEGRRAAREGSVVVDMAEREEADMDAMEVDERSANEQPEVDSGTVSARRLVKTILDQSNLSPFPLDKRPLHWDYAQALSLYPLPSSLVLADAEVNAFVVGYMGCSVMNPGRIVEARRGGLPRATWVEYDTVLGKGVVKDEALEVDERHRRKGRKKVVID